MVYETSNSVFFAGSPGTTYYYRIVAQNSEGTSYGDEMSFTTLTDTIAPSCSISINSNATYTNNSTVTISLFASDNSGVTGYYLSLDPTEKREKKREKGRILNLK